MKWSRSDRYQFPVKTLKSWCAIRMLSLALPEWPWGLCVPVGGVSFRLGSWKTVCRALNGPYWAGNLTKKDLSVLSPWDLGVYPQFHKWQERGSSPRLAQLQSPWSLKCQQILRLCQSKTANVDMNYGGQGASWRTLCWDGLEGEGSETWGTWEETENGALAWALPLPGQYGLGQVPGQ